jgi:hypothetical protein
MEQYLMQVITEDRDTELSLLQSYKIESFLSFVFFALVSLPKF